MPSKYEFQQLIEKIEEAINLYKNSPCRFNENKIFLSNGKAINFEIKPHNVPHLLGININNLKNSKFLKETKPLDMVEELINRYNTFYERMIRGEIIFGDIFSDFIKEKIVAFPNVLKCSLNEIEFVCKYNPEKTYTTGQVDSYGCEYYIAFNNDEDNYIYLGLKKEENGNFYSYFYTPASILYQMDKEKATKLLSNIIKNQQIFLANGLERRNIGKTENIRNADKLSKVQNLMNLADIYDSNLILNSEYIYVLKKFMSLSENSAEVNNFISSFTLALVKGKQINNYQDINDDFNQLVEAYNLFIKSQNGDIEGELAELKALKQQLEKAKAEIASQSATIEKQKAEISRQKEIIDEQDKKLNSIEQFKEEAFQLFKKYN